MTERICWYCKKPLSDEEWIDDEEYGDVHTRRPARVSTHFEELIILTPAERDALCATVKHLRAQIDAATKVIEPSLPGVRY